MSKNSFSNIFNKYYISSIFIILAIGTVASFLTYKKVSTNTQEELLRKVSIIANSLNIEEVKSLKGISSDINNPNYISVKNKLQKIKSLDDKNSFIYLWTYREGNNVVFLVDSEPTTSTDYSPPGQIYDEATELDKNVLLGVVKNGIEFSEDRWGHWLTALVPILDENQNIIAVLGIDMNSKIYYDAVYTTVAIPVISTIFVLIIIIIGLILQKKENEYLALKEKLLSTARHDLRAPLTGIAWLTESVLNNKDKLDQEIPNIEIVHKKINELIININKIIEQK